MFTKNQLLEKLNNTKISAEEELSEFLKYWRIDPIYEDEENNEFFDEMAVSKIKHALKLKEQGKNDEEITSIINSGIISSINAPAIKRNYVQETFSSSKNELNNVTIDITSQTLSLLAESIAQKISVEITDKIKNSEIFEPVMDSAKLTRDNEILSKQIERLLDENNRLKARNHTLNKEISKFRPLFGKWYIKQE